jgi:synaptosomal-associated protein 25
MPTNVTPAPENGAPRSELQELQLKSGQVTDESLESTRRMIALCEESHEVEMKSRIAVANQRAHGLLK